ncbi:hypothetical protein VTN77DRAFT_1584 [Rasamsonia byssochlamydoides]|uniref:uncharacterized protein n=1 Tax=Rasamsonia byssochlamydoides TaxID=89139 RepID=UPI0037447E52
MQMTMTPVRLSVTLLVAFCWLSRALHNHISLSPLLSLGEQSPLGREAESLSFSSTWQLLGPFRTGTREATWGADPLERAGGFSNLSYEPDALFNSVLGKNGHVKWRTIPANSTRLFSGGKRAVVGLNIGFPEVDWAFLRSIYGWSVLQYQAWARGNLTVHGYMDQTVELVTDDVLELRIDGTSYFGGDFYGYRRAPIVVKLQPGTHVVELRLVRDVRALGGVGDPTIEVQIEGKVCHERLNVDTNSILVSETTHGRLLNSLASINIRNDMDSRVEVLWISSLDSPHEAVMKEEKLLLAPYQSRPLVFDIILGQSSNMEFSVEIAYRLVNGGDGIWTTTPFKISLVERSSVDAQRLTFLHPAGVVSYAILRPPPRSSTCLSSQRPLPVLLSLHGAGLEADSKQVREMLNAAYGLCAWMLFPSGVTPWSGDDWHTWGIADIQASVDAIPLWIESVRWDGPGVALNDWMVIGHSNGGQGAWFLSTHFPDKTIALGPISAYTSIEIYVPFNLWQDAEPLISSVLHIARSNYKHELLLDNLAGIPVMQQHGSEDDNVPAYHSRLMHELMAFTGWPSRYEELPGKGHWFDGVMTTSALLSFYDTIISQRLAPSLPLEFSIVIPSSGDMGSKGGIFVDQLQTPDQYGHIKVTRSVEDGFWHLKTHNIRRFHFSPEEPRVETPAALILDDREEPFFVDLAKGATTYYFKNHFGEWTASNETGWRNISQRYGRQLGSMDAILRSSGPFTIRACSPGANHVASQISRNLFQYFAADSLLLDGCNVTSGAQSTEANVITVALGDLLPPAASDAFPISISGDRLRLSRESAHDRVNHPSSCHQQEDLSSYDYELESGMGALFLRPLDEERLELVVWGADIAGLEHAARLVPALTGVGQPDFVVLSAKCRWMGPAGVYALGFFDHSWRISAASYIGGFPINDRSTRVLY